jgi:ankyrin repeat protein
VAFDNVNATNADGDTALHWAAGVGDLKAGRLLIAAGIEVNQPADLGLTYQAQIWRLDALLGRDQP